MRTENQREASRRNGAASLGPVTPEGKALSARNAITHGLTARDVVLSNEDPHAYRAVADSFIAGWNPIDNLELLLVEDLAACYWRLLRAEANETALSDLQMELDAAEAGRLFEGASQRVRSALAARALADNTGALASLDRHATRLSRQFDRAWRNLESLREGRNAQKTVRKKIARLQNEPDKCLINNDSDSQEDLCHVG